MVAKLKLSSVLIVFLAILSACSSRGETESIERQIVATPTRPVNLNQPELNGDDLFQNVRLGQESSVSQNEDEDDVAIEFQDDVTVGLISIAAQHPTLIKSLSATKTALEQGGYIAGQNMTLIEKDAKGDIEALNRMAQELVDADVDVIIANSTPALLAVYELGRQMDEPIPLLFSTVTNPYVIGVAASASDHPSWLTGSQVFPPLLSTIEMLRGFSDSASTIGVVYNPGESNSVAQMDELTSLAGSYDFTIVASEIVDQSETGEAAQKLVDQEVDYLYVFQDTTASAGASAIVEVANAAGIPLVTNIEELVEQGASIGLAASFAEDGLHVGRIAVELLNGNIDLSEVDIQRVNEFESYINLDAATAQGLQIPAQLQAAAIDLTPELKPVEIEVEPEPVEEEGEAAVEEEIAAEEDRITIGMITIAPAPPLELIRNSFKQTLAEGGFVDGDNLIILDRNVEGDPSKVAAIIEEFAEANVDLIVATSTPIVRAAYDVMVTYEEPIPVVFQAVTSPYAAGVAQSSTEHPDWLVGSQLFPPLLATLDTVTSLVPDIEKFGMIYQQTAANAIAQYEETLLLADGYPFEMLARGIDEPDDALAAAEALLAEGVDVLFFSQDLAVAERTAEIAELAAAANVPLVTNTSTSVADGAALGLSTSLVEDGRVSGEIALSILRGESEISDMKIERVSKFDVLINRDAAEAQGLVLTDDLLNSAIDSTPE